MLVPNPLFENVYCRHQYHRAGEVHAVCQPAQDVSACALCLRADVAALGDSGRGGGLRAGRSGGASSGCY